MILWRRTKWTRSGDFSCDRFWKRFLCLCLRFLRCCALLLIHIKDGGAILFSGVWSLAIDLGRIVCAPEQIEKFVVTCLAGIKRDLYCLGALHIAGDHRSHTWRLFKNCLGAPKTTAREIGHVCLATVHLRAKCNTQNEDQIGRQRQEEGLGFTFDRWRSTNLPHTSSTFRHRLM